jgi:hypothetical protein
MRKEESICDSTVISSTKYQPEIKEEEEDGMLVDEQTVLRQLYGGGGTSTLQTPDVEVWTDDKERRRNVTNNKHNKLQTDSASQQKHSNNNVSSANQLKGKNNCTFF